MAVIRSMTTKEADHGRATYLMRTGYVPVGPIQYPSLGSLVAKELGDADGGAAQLRQHRPVPRFNPAAFGAGFLGPQFAPLIVGDSLGRGVANPGQVDQALKVQDLEAPGERREGPRRRPR